nr:reverse transcriptase domain-containing protein [Tanacetum cinerariifolium]
MNDVCLKAMQNKIDMVKNKLRNEMKTSIQTSLSNQTNEIKNMMASLLQMNTTSTLRSGTLPGNTVANPKGELKAITTRSGLATDGPTIPNPPKSVNPEEDECVKETYTDLDHAEYTIKVPPPPPVQKPMPPIQRNFVLHTRDSLLPQILELKCKALADQGASINLMPLSVWKKLGLPDLIPTCMTLELANRAICTPDRITRDVFVPVGKFTFPVDFVVVDYESDPRVPLILRRQFLRTARALIDVHDTGKFEQWQFRIQQYLQLEHYALWEVIKFGDSYNVPANVDPADLGTRRTITSTTEDIQKKKNDVKARTTLLVSLPDEHHLRFSKYKTARELWAAILKTFGGLPELIPTRMTLELANRAICTPDGVVRDVFVPVGKFTFPADFVVVDYESDHRVPLTLVRPFLRTARALIDVYGEEMILHDGDERLTLNIKHDTTSYSNHPHRDLVNLINIFNVPSEDCLEVSVSNQQSGNPTFLLHKQIASPEVTHEIHDSVGCNFLSKELPDIDSFNDIHSHFDVDPLSGSTTYSSNSLLEEFTDELAVITYPPDYDDNLMCDIESDLREIEFLLYQGEDSDLKDSIDQTDLANLNDLFVDPTPEMFTDEQPPNYSFPSRFDVYPDDFLEIKSDANNFYDDLLTSRGRKSKSLNS